MNNLELILSDIQQQTENLNWKDKLIYIANNFQKIIFTTSLSNEDQVIIDLVYNSSNVTIITLDTGRLFPETYDLWSKTEKKYNIKIQSIFPDSEHIKSYVNQYGINGFYDSIEARKKCCHIRKVLPLNNIVNNFSIWITGQRKLHSLNRENLQEFEVNDNIIKYNPLYNLTTQEIEEFIKENNILYNELYNKNYKSIGCQPCTRAIKNNEDERAGRWYWENSENNECGLHIKNGRILRVKKND